MYIERTKLGSNKQHAKVLLRESYREGQKIKTRTLANLSRWNGECIQILEDALKVRRDNPGTRYEEEANLRIYELACKAMVFSALGQMLRLLDSLVRGHYQRTVEGAAPVGWNRDALSKLEFALSTKRKYPGTELEDKANILIYELFWADRLRDKNLSESEVKSKVVFDV